MLKSLTFALAFLSILTPARAAYIGTRELAGTNAANIYIIGKIEAGDENIFRRTVLRLVRAGKYIGMVKIFSPGGNIFSALDIGRQIHLVKASTVAPRLLDNPPGVRWCETDQSSMQFNPSTGMGDSRCECASACFLVWAGGVGREGDVIGIHRLYFDATMFGSLTGSEAGDKYRVAEEEVRSYLAEMDIPDYLIRLMFANSSRQMRYLRKSELEGISGLPPAIEELKIARCGERPSSYANVSDQVRANYFYCAHRVYEETSRDGVAAYLRRYSNQ